jgi:hypothetical protein
VFGKKFPVNATPQEATEPQEEGRRGEQLFFFLSQCPCKRFCFDSYEIPFVCATHDAKQEASQPFFLSKRGLEIDEDWIPFFVREDIATPNIPVGDTMSMNLLEECGAFCIKIGRQSFLGPTSGKKVAFTIFHEQPIPLNETAELWDAFYVF